MNNFEFKHTYTFDDFCLVPKFSNIKSRLDVNIETYLTKHTKIKIPIVAANMDSVICDNLADVLLELGTYPIFHRFTTIEEITRWAKKYENNCYLSCGIEYKEIMEIANKYNSKGLCIDIAHGHTETMINIIKTIKNTYPKLEIIAGNVCTSAGCEDLILAGADAIKVGIGCGAACITRIMTGHGSGQMSSIFECYEVAKKYGVPIIADGGIEIPKHFVMALAGGASCIMAGKLFVKTNESAGVKIIKDNINYVKYRGQASKEFQEEYKGGLKNGTVEEGVSMLLKTTGSAKNIIEKYTGGLRSALTYSGALDLEGFKKKVEFKLVSNNYLKESNYRGDDVF